MISLGAGSRLALLKESGGIATIALNQEIEGSSENAGSGHSGEEEGLEGDHNELIRGYLCWMEW